MSKLIATNPKAGRDYAVLEAIECGIELKGSEVKSLRAAKSNLRDSFARIESGEVILYNLHISPYAQASYLNPEPLRPRKLLLQRRQIDKLSAQVAQKGFTLVPTKMYFGTSGFVKVELALCKGKKVYDRRQDIKRREVELQTRRALKHKRR